MNSQTQNNAQRISIQGVTNRGQIFRPRDWAKRLCGCVSVVGPNRHQEFSPYVYVSFLNGNKSLVIEAKFAKVDPNGYNFLMSFAKDNNLKIIEDNGLSLAVNQ